MKILKISLLIAAITLFSCSENSSSKEEGENDEVSVNETTESNFFALEVGNSWVYKNYKYDSQTETYKDCGVIDSLVIVGKDYINGQLYYQLRRRTSGNENKITFCNPNGEYFENVIEVDGELLDDMGKVLFTTTNFEEREISDGDYYSILEKLVDGKEEIVTDAGTFETFYSERYAKAEGIALPGRDVFHYAKGIGLVYDTCSFAGIEKPTSIRKLSAYSVQ